MMRGVMRKLILLMVAFFFLLGVSSARANDIYIAQSASGAANGADCADAFPYTFFNDGSHWPSPIGPGTTVHLCGTINAAGGTSGLLTFQGGGTAGNLITLKFENGAVLQAPYWGQQGAISASGLKYILVDGGANGSITATANGTNLANQQGSGSGVYFANVSNSEIKNMTISNIYVHATSPNDLVGGGTYGINWLSGSNVTIDANTINDAYAGIRYTFSASATNANVSIFNNTVFNCNWDINVGTGGANAVLNGVLIYGNTIHDWINWDEIGGAIFHHDGIFVFTTGIGASVTGLQVYNNLGYGNMTVMTAHIYLSQTPGSITGSYVFNNVMYNTSSGYPTNGFILDWATNTSILNNTFVGTAASNTGGSGYVLWGQNPTVKNNIFALNYVSLLTNTGAIVAASDFNDFFNVKDVGRYGLPFYVSLADWRAGTGFDANSVTTDPLLNAASIPPYQLTSVASGAYRKGVNLTSLCGTVPALCTDAAGNARPSIGGWDMGAYYLGGKTSGSPNPPTKVTAVLK